MKRKEKEWKTLDKMKKNKSDKTFRKKKDGEKRDQEERRKVKPGTLVVIVSCLSTSTCLVLPLLPASSTFRLSIKVLEAS